MVRTGRDIRAGGRFFGLSAPMLLLNGREEKGSDWKTSWTRDEVIREEEGIGWIIKRGVWEAGWVPFCFFFLSFFSPPPLVCTIIHNVGEVMEEKSSYY